jgi:hypothetical protein
LVGRNLESLEKRDFKILPQIEQWIERASRQRQHAQLKITKQCGTRAGIFFQTLLRGFNDYRHDVSLMGCSNVSALLCVLRHKLFSYPNYLDDLSPLFIGQRFSTARPRGASA